MNEVAHGINVYYNNQKDISNLVFFPDSKSTYYDDGAMLFEVIGDDSIYMLTEKVENMIKAFPDKQLSVTPDSITDGFKWLYGTIEDEELPVATELFRSNFNDVLQQEIVQMYSPNDFNTVEDFYLACYALYMEYIKTFCVFVQAIAADASGVSDEFQHIVAEVFISSANDLYNYYAKKCSVRREDVYASIETVQITNFLQLLIFEYCRMKKSRKVIKECANCGRLFIPTGRVDAIYCPLLAPGYPDKTCKEVGAQLKRAEKRRSDSKEHKHHNTTCRLYNVIRRSREKGDSDDVISHYQRQIDNEMKRYIDGKESKES